MAAPFTAIAPAAAAEDTKITITGKPDPAVYFDEVGPAAADVIRHRGKLETAAGEPLVGETVTLTRTPANGKTATASKETGAEGRYEFLTEAQGNARYRVSYDGDEITYNDSESAVDQVNVMRDFNARVVKKERKAVLKGNINPGWNNKIVRWQHKRCERCKWQVIARRKTGDKGAWRFDAAYPPSVGKEWFYRATIPGDDSFIRSFSAELKTFRTARSAARTAVR